MIIELKSVLEEGALGGQQLERLLRFRIMKNGLDEADRVGAPALQHHAAVLPLIVRSMITTNSAS